ncbi:MAG: outer membrane beta-barrel protein [Pseudomonadota bacterium]
MRPTVDRKNGTGALRTALLAVAASTSLIGSAKFANAQAIAGDQRIEKASAAPTTSSSPSSSPLAALSETQIYSADAPDGTLNAPIQSGAEAFNIPSEVLYSWSGPYVGLRAGSVIANGNAAFTGALEAGYDFQPTARIVTGIEGDIALRGDASTLTNTPALGTLTGRLGFLPVDRILVYGEAGGALGSVRGANAAGGTDTQLSPGYTLGAGAEFALDEQLTFVGEYTYTDLQDRTVPTGTDTLQSNSFEAGIKLRF